LRLFDIASLPKRPARLAAQAGRSFYYTHSAGDGRGRIARVPDRLGRAAGSTS